MSSRQPLPAEMALRSHSSLSHDALSPWEPEERSSRYPVQGVLIDALGWEACVRRIETWAQRRESRVVALCNVHSIVTSRFDAELHAALEAADLVLPDGMPVAWTLRYRGFAGQPRIDGPGLMLRACEAAAQSGVPVFLYGNTEATLERLRGWLAQHYPGVNIVGSMAPPFGEVSDLARQADVDAINASGAGLLLVSLGCPKQEKWMASQRGRIHSVMIGVGAAFNYHSGNVRRAPPWMQRIGLEWLYRLGQEPGRLFGRYAVTNSLFIATAFVNLFRRRR